VDIFSKPSGHGADARVVCFGMVSSMGELLYVHAFCMGFGSFGLWRLGFGSGPVDPGHAIVTVCWPLANEVLWMGLVRWHYYFNSKPAPGGIPPKRIGVET
jgi:hypothetical protein